MIKFFRELLYHFLLSNRSKKLYDLELEQAVLGDANSLEEYCDTVVREMNEEAESLLISILPLILRIKIHTVFLDTNPNSTVLSKLRIDQQCLCGRV